MTAFVPTMVSLDSHTAPAVRTLVVDDSVVVRTVIERILNADPGFTVVHKTNSAENALRYLAEHSVDLVLLDIELPGQSGLAALPAILRSNPQGKVAILSGRCEEGSAAAVEALALGATIGGGNAHAVELTKRLLDQAESGDLSANHALELVYCHTCQAGEEVPRAREAFKARAAAKAAAKAATGAKE